MRAVGFGSARVRARGTAMALRRDNPAPKGNPMNIALIRRAAALALGLFAASGAVAQSRDQIRIVGSSTVFPYAQAVAEQFARRTRGKAPVVETTGTGGGLRAFCGGVGPSYPDIVGASRAITRGEYRACQAHGVDRMDEVLIGHDGMTLAQSIDGPTMNLTKAQLFQALAASVEVDGEIVANPYRNWREIDPDLPDMAIEVFGPPPTSGTRDAFVELVMHPGCESFPVIAALEGVRRAEVCARMRQDGPFIEAGENDNLIVQRLRSDATTLGLFGYSFLYENADTLKAVAIDGVSPDETTIGGDYQLSRPLYIYIKSAHRGVIPGLDAFIAEYLSEESLGQDGYLADRGLIPMTQAEREAMRGNVVATNGIQLSN